MTTQLFLNVRCLGIFRGLMGHVTTGILDYDRKPLVDLGNATAAFAEACIDKDVSLAFKGKVPGELPAAEHSVLRHYLNRVREAKADAKSRGRVEPKTLYVTHDLYDTLHGEVFGEGFTHYSIPARVGGSQVEYAMDRALWLYQQTNSQIVVADVLQEIANKFHIRSALPDLGEARLELGRRSSLYIRDYAMFALMLTDPEQSAVARKTLFNEALSNGYAVSQYIRGVDRYEVGRISAAEEDGFRDELKLLSTSPANQK